MARKKEKTIKSTSKNIFYLVIFRTGKVQQHRKAQR